ncbi:acyl-CoA dehydrogenase [Frankia sp. CNm7]|uniref:Acyl-CoA dehydrogenase n=1 Tax=Frankia nepalensis TaxID=1836974 RepID=A0A937UTQ3_9ACTN|nr:acyl-CoA dehydrogenase family protein [Frankia nepalensis]MBL7500959.1 acyl-CoA dehydrogenase [Frankia nepalensis]MBL7510066.1 acyl-CoA dehydrogenase [Frankia nepalensis]MBL7521727.1 acyl-CoA dehydrogenase [Frankia nepalensis]MBL7633328.1 acyl-CoA dehydrogenase [Frankia nepalensis]
MDVGERELLAEALRGTMTETPAGAALDAALGELGWEDLLAEEPDVAVPLVFSLLGETGAHAPLLNDVVLAAAGTPVGGTVALPYAGGRTVVWDRKDPGGEGVILDDPLPLRVVTGEDTSVAGDPAALAAGRRALGWWLVGTGRAMLGLARTHALDRAQFGKPIAGFQAVRHRLAETHVALEGAEATLTVAEDELGSLLAKAAAGQAALDAARHCQQVLGGIGFTAEHALHHHIRRALTLDGLLGSTRELTRAAGAHLRAHQSAPRLAQL